MQSDKDGNHDESYPKLKSQASARRARERELERKRARGEISCAECRRLKLKCNKKVPCNSCIRRGCHSICPNGLLTTGQGSRFVLANTDKLHSKLIQMSQRIRQLEDALQIAHSSVSTTAHPLLAEPLLAMKSDVDGLKTGENKKEESEVADEEEELTTALGTLTMEDCGASRFVALNLVEPSYDEHEFSFTGVGAELDSAHKMPESLIHAASGFPLAHVHLPKNELLTFLKDHLPTCERATALVEAYLGNVSWMPRPIQREQIMEELLPFVYRGRYLDPSSQDDESIKSDMRHRMHNLALAMALFACGAACDLTLPPSNQEGKMYHALALAAMNTHSVMSPGGASLETVQAIVLVALYDFFSCEKPTMECGWKTVSFALIVAASIGLHRDPGHWDLEPKYTQRRRFVFWEIFCFDKYKSFGTGRPAIFHLQEVDCEFPEDCEWTTDKDGEQREGLNRWCHRFVKEVVGPISEYLCLTRPIKYSEILDFDRRIREFDDPPLTPSLSDMGTLGELRPRMWGLQKELSLLTIHRNFFARAMIRDPENPLRSPFAPSFLAAYACSAKLLRNVRVCFEHMPGLILRLWPLWVHALTAAVVIGSVASNVKQLPLANAAFRNLDLGVRLFQEGKEHPVARRGLPALIRLRERAVSALQSQSEAGVSPGENIPKVEADESDELKILHGSARVVHRTHTEEFMGCGHGSPARSSGGGPSTPESGAIDNVGSSSSIRSTEASGFSSSTRQGSCDDVLFTLGCTNATSTPETSTLCPIPAEDTCQPTSEGLEQDIESLLGMIHSPSSNVATPGSNTLQFESVRRPPDPQPQSINQQFSMPYCNPLSTDSSFVTSNNPWVTDASQFESAISGTYGDGRLQGPFGTLPNVTTAAPSYDMTWISSSGPSDPAEITGDAAQFVEDWRLQAAIEGYCMTEPDPNVGMMF